MENYQQSPTKELPFINADFGKNTLHMKGKAAPKNITELKTFLDWMDEFLSQEPKQIVFVFEMLKMNSIFHLLITDLFIRTVRHKRHNKTDVYVLWYYDANNDDMFEIGEDFSDSYPFDFSLVMKP